jgi:riboflavin biosynthesis pyrimidine reductase
MRAKWNGIVGAILLVCVAGTGCEPKQEPTPLGEEMQREMRLAAPVVGGPSQEFSVAKAPADITAAVEAAMKDAGVSLVQEGGSDADRWLFGKSLADRRVLVQILPVYPGRAMVKVTVEGGDTLARDLLKNLSAGIDRRVR